MTKDRTIFQKDADCLSVHEYLFGKFVEELAKKNIEFTTHPECDLNVSVTISVSKVRRKK